MIKLLIMNMFIGKKQKLVLGMVFEIPKQLKDMMFRYVVANDYHYDINHDNMRLFVKCWLNVVLGSASLECGFQG